MSVKIFDNGMKVVLMQSAKRPALLQVFDKDNCMLAQREIKSTVKKDGSKLLEKLTIRQSKNADSQIEYLSIKTNPSDTFLWNSRRAVCVNDSDNVYINQRESDFHGDSYSEYHIESMGNNQDFRDLKFPFVKPRIIPMSKLDELKLTLNKMWEQWHTPTGKFRKNFKPLMPRSVKNLFNKN